MKILVSACLLGVGCRYDGKEKKCNDLHKLSGHHLIPICPEIYGGLPTPRPPCEQSGGRVITKSGNDVTENYKLGAENTLKIAKMFGCIYALLKERSPSCGKGFIYDGTFSDKLKSGNGITADLLIQNKIEVFGESEIDRLIKRMEG